MRTARHLQVVSSDGTTLENNCHYRSRDLRRVSDAGLNNIQVAFLQVFRHLCETLSSETEYGRRDAHELAKLAFGERNGSLLIDHTTNLLTAIQTERCGNFSYMPTDCPVCSSFLSEEEWCTLSLLHAAQHEDAIALAHQATLMTAGGSAHDTTIAAWTLGRLFDRLEHEPFQST